MVAGMHERLPEAREQRPVDVADEIAKMVDGDDDARDRAGLDGGLVHPRRHERLGGGPEVRGHAVAGCQLRGNGCENVATVKRGAWPLHAEATQPLAVE